MVGENHKLGASVVLLTLAHLLLIIVEGKKMPESCYTYWIGILFMPAYIRSLSQETKRYMVYIQFIKDTERRKKPKFNP